MSTTLNGDNMDDRLATELCAEAMQAAGGIEMRRSESGELVTTAGYPYYWTQWKAWSPYDPLHDDAQAMALARRFMLAVDFFVQKVSAPPTHPQDIFVYFDEDGETANRAIVYCVSRMQASIREGGDK